MNTHLTRCSYDEWECKLEYEKGHYFIPSPGMRMLLLRWAYKLMLRSCGEADCLKDEEKRGKRRAVKGERE
jgi:hypothetical protein